MRPLKKNPPKPELPVPGYPRPYVRDGVRGLPIERQVEMLEVLGLDFSNEKMIWVDRLSRAKIAAKAALPDRDQVVAPTHDGETVYVAGLRVLGWDNLDVMRAATIAFSHDCRIHCADTGDTYSKETTADEMIKALTRSEEARRRARTTSATDEQVARRKRRVEKGIEIARLLWNGPETVAEIVKLSGVSRRTLYDHLPPRKLARERKRKGKEHA